MDRPRKAAWLRKSITLTLLSTPFSRKLFWPFDRTPLAEKEPPASSRAPASPGTTPGDSRARKLNTRCPPSGNSAVCLLVMFWPRIVVSVWSSGAAALISTLCEMSPTSSMSGTATRPPAVNTTSFCTPFLNPVASTVTVYVPGFKAGRTNSPVSFVVTWYARPVASSTIVTLVFGTAAPCGSVTVPAKVAKSRWANSEMENNASKKHSLN